MTSQREDGARRPACSSANAVALTSRSSSSPRVGSRAKLTHSGQPVPGVGRPRRGSRAGTTKEQQHLAQVPKQPRRGLLSSDCFHVGTVLPRRVYVCFAIEIGTAGNREDPSASFNFVNSGCSRS